MIRIWIADIMPRARRKHYLTNLAAGHKVVDIGSPEFARHKLVQVDRKLLVVHVINVAHIRDCVYLGLREGAELVVWNRPLVLSGVDFLKVLDRLVA